MHKTFSTSSNKRLFDPRPDRGRCAILLPIVPSPRALGPLRISNGLLCPDVKHLLKLHQFYITLVTLRWPILLSFLVAFKTFSSVRPPSFALRRRRGGSTSASPAESGEEVEVNTREEGSQSGETGTDDGHGRLNLRPHVTCDYGIFTGVRVFTTWFLTSD